MRSILIIDDDPTIVQNLVYALRSRSITPYSAENGKKGLELAAQERPDAVFLDFRLPDTDGLQLIPKLLAIDPDIIIIMITGTTQTDIAVQAIKAGAYDFIEKPFELEKLFAVLKKAEKEKSTQDKVRILEGQVQKHQDEFIGQHPAITQIKDMVNKVVTTPNFTILITGESGTGKEVLVRYIHQHSLYAGKPLVDINCSAIPETLLESELFGHEKGSFTDAQNTKRGLFELANNGIIFLDEIGDMSLNLQAKLLRVLENKTIRRIGGEENIPLNISIIAATNRDLARLIQEHKFREDLYYRLHIIPIYLPPLRERTEDIAPLIEYFIKKLNISFRKNIRGITPKALALLQQYSYPGNIRELRNILERAMLLETTDQVTEANLQYLGAAPANTESVEQEDGRECDYKRYQETVMHKVEKSYFEQLLKKYNGNVSKAAEHAQIMPPSFSRIMKRLGIERKDYT